MICRTQPSLKIPANTQQDTEYLCNCLLMSCMATMASFVSLPQAVAPVGCPSFFLGPGLESHNGALCCVGSVEGLVGLGLASILGSVRGLVFGSVWPWVWVWACCLYEHPLDGPPWGWGRGGRGLPRRGWCCLGIQLRQHLPCCGGHRERRPFPDTQGRGRGPLSQRWGRWVLPPPPPTSGLHLSVF